MHQIFHVIFRIIVRIRYYPRGSCTEHINGSLYVTTANLCNIHRSKVSSFVIFYNTDRLLKRNAGTYTKTSKFPVFTGKIEHAQTVCTRPSLFLGWAWVRDYEMYAGFAYLKVHCLLFFTCIISISIFIPSIHLLLCTNYKFRVTHTYIHVHVHIYAHIPPTTYTHYTYAHTHTRTVYTKTPGSTYCLSNIAILYGAYWS